MKQFVIFLSIFLFALMSQAIAQEFPEWARLTKESQSLYQKGQGAQAIAASKKALELAEKASFDGEKKGNMIVAISLKNLASLYKNEKDYSNAQPNSERSLGLFEKIYPPDHPQVAKALSDLAEIYDALGQYAQAEPLYKRALQIHEKNRSKDNSEYIATIKASLARIFRETNRIK